MSATRTKFPKNVVPARKVHQATTIVGKNGIPIDALATIEPGSTIIGSNNTDITYSAPTITFDASIDLSDMESFGPQDAKHTGVLLFTDSDNKDYFVDKASINNIAKTMDIYIDADLASSPSAVALKKGWFTSEAELVNRLQTTTSAVVDTIEFRDIDIKLDLDGSKGDSVKIVDDQNNQLDINEDGSVNVNIVTAVTDTTSIVNTFGEVSSINSATLTTIVSYTAPAAITSFIQRVEVSGTNIAKYEVSINNVVIDRKYTQFGSSLNETFEYTGPPSENGHQLTVGDVVRVKVEHSRPMVGDFNARIQSLEIA